MTLTRPQELEPILESIGYSGVNPLFIGVHCSDTEFARFFKQIFPINTREITIARQYGLQRERYEAIDSGIPEELKAMSSVPDLLEGVELALVQNFCGVHNGLRNLPIEGTVYTGAQGFVAVYRAPLDQTHFQGDIREKGKLEQRDPSGTNTYEYIDAAREIFVMHRKNVDLHETTLADREQSDIDDAIRAERVREQRRYFREHE